MSVSAWEAVFFVVILKIPVIYLAVVVWWAVRAVPEPEGGDGAGVLTAPVPPCGWDDWKRERPGRRRPVRPLNPSRRRARVAA